MKKLISIILVLSIILLYNANYYQEVKDFVCDKLLDNNMSENIKSDNDINKIKQFENIEIGDSKESVIDKIDEPDRIDQSEYDFNWYVYNSYKENFVMIGIENNKVVALFTNNINSCENEEIYINKDINYIRKNYEILNYRDKENIRYEITSNQEYDIIYKNKKYITVFYDKFNDNKIWAYQIIEKSCEDKMKDIYPKENKKIEPLGV